MGQGAVGTAFAMAWPCLLVWRWSRNKGAFYVRVDEAVLSALEPRGTWTPAILAGGAEARGEKGRRGRRGDAPATTRDTRGPRSWEGLDFVHSAHHLGLRGSSAGCVATASVLPALACNCQPRRRPYPSTGATYIFYRFAFLERKEEVMRSIPKQGAVGRAAVGGPFELVDTEVSWRCGSVCVTRRTSRDRLLRPSQPACNEWWRTLSTKFRAVGCRASHSRTKTCWGTSP